MKIPLKLSVHENWDDIFRHFVIIFIPLAVFFGSLTLFLYFRDVRAERHTLENKEIYNIESQTQIVSSAFSAISKDLKYLSMQNALATYLDNAGSEQLRLLEHDWISFCAIKSDYYKIRYVDEHGMEMIRIDCTKGQPRVAAESALKNVSDKKFFHKTLSLQRSEIYVSPFEMRGTQTEEDVSIYAPILRFSMPIFDKAGRNRGMLVLNSQGNSLFEELRKASVDSLGEIFLVNDNSYYLTTQEKGKDWKIGADGDGDLKKPLPDEWHRINGEESGQFRTDEGLMTFGTIYPLLDSQQSLEHDGINIVHEEQKKYCWKIVSFVPTKVLTIWPKKILNRILLLYSVCLVIIAVCSLMLARTGVRRKKAEEAMREREEQLRAINAAAANAIIVIDNNKKVLHWNPAAEKLFQYTAEEAMNKPITEIIAPPKHQSSLTKISKKFNIPDKDGAGTKVIELFGYKKDGSEFPVEVSFSAFKSSDQWHTVGIIRDISARKKMEKEVLRAQKFESLGVMASGIAHDFNNLLTAIIGNITLVCRLTDPADENFELLKSANKAAMRAKSLSQQLLIFSKGGNPIRKTMSIAPLVRDAVDFALHGSTISCAIDIPDDLWLVDIDSGQIGQVLQNLIINSKEAITGSGTIAISCRNAAGADLPALPVPVKGKFIEIKIRDNGCGIGKKDISKIFDPYFTTKDNGSGLGLSIVYSILNKHDGHIAVNSEPGQGTTFTLLLPASLDQHLKADERPESPVDRHYQIMVVDGEEMLLNIASRMLTHLGHECICVKNSIEAIEIYKHLWKTGTPIDGVIIDLTIPGGMGGKETAGAIFDINPEAKIIVSSGYSNDPVMVDYDEYGFCAAIAKPFDMDELRDTINSVIS